MWPFSLYTLTTILNGSILSVLMLDLLGCSILLLLSLFGTSIEAEYQVKSGILRNAVVYPSVVISMADSGRES
jgi:hypothetical protein